MKYGIREICEVVLRAKGTMAVGNKIFYKGEPVLYFDTLKTSSFEGSSTTVYAQGGRGNARLMSWDGEKTTTFTMEDALISPEGLMILAGAGLIQGGQVIDGSTVKITTHVTETIAASKVTITGGTSLTFDLKKLPVYDANKEDSIYVMLMKDGEIISEPYIGTLAPISEHPNQVKVQAITDHTRKPDGVKYVDYTLTDRGETTGVKFVAGEFDAILVDYYTETQDTKAMQINITPDSFGGSFYLEASTLFRNEDGIDVPADFVIPNCRVQSNFSFSMASSGDPSTFTFTLDCFPDYTRWDPTTKVLACIQVIPEAGAEAQYRSQTDAGDDISDIAEG